jgi:hypothetical protein
MEQITTTIDDLQRQGTLLTKKLKSMNLFLLSPESLVYNLLTLHPPCKDRGRTPCVKCHG